MYEPRDRRHPAFRSRLQSQEANAEDDIRSAAAEVFAELDEAGVDYLLVGGVALLTLIEGRNTQDVDLIVQPEDLEKLRGRWHSKTETSPKPNTAAWISTCCLHPIHSSPKSSAAIGPPFLSTRVTFPIATRDGLLVLKLYALPSMYRQQKLARAALYENDILMLHQGVSVDDEAILERLVPHLPRHDIDELRKILVGTEIAETLPVAHS